MNILLRWIEGCGNWCFVDYDGIILMISVMFVCWNNLSMDFLLTFRFTIEEVLLIIKIVMALCQLTIKLS